MTPGPPATTTGSKANQIIISDQTQKPVQQIMTPARSGNTSLLLGGATVDQNNNKSESRMKEKRISVYATVARGNAGAGGDNSAKAGDNGGGNAQ